MYIAFLILLIAFMLYSLITGYRATKKPKNTVRTEATQVKRYRRTMAWMWGPAIVVVVMSLIGGISLADLGLRPISINYNIWFTANVLTINYNVWFTAIVLTISGIMLAFSLRTVILSLTSKKFRDKQKDAIASDSTANDILPRTKKEKRQYILMSISSGICEELVYRGFIAFLLQAAFPEIPIFLVILIPSVLFGIGHLYQGWEGVVETGAVGAIFMCLLLVTDSLIPVMFLHFVTNAAHTFLLSEEY